MRTSIEVAKYIEQLLKEKKMKPVDLAEKTGVNKSTISRYFSGTRKIPMDEIGKFAEALDVEPADLLIEKTEENSTPFYKENNETTTTTTKEDAVTYIHNARSINLYGSVAAGALAIIDGVTELNVEKLTVSPQFLGPYANCKELFAMRVNGDSMNEVIRDGEIVIAKQQETYKDGDIVIFSHNNEYSLKRYRPNEIEGFVLFKSESTDSNFKDIIVPKDTNGELKILGKVVYCGMIF